MKAALKVERKRGARLKPLRRGDFARLGEILRTAIVRESQAGRAADGSPLKPHADGSPSTLTRTGALLASVRVTRLESDVVEVRPGVPYAAEVQAERPFVGVNPTAAREMTAELRAAFSRNVALADYRVRGAAKATDEGDREAGEDEEEA